MSFNNETFAPGTFVLVPAEIIYSDTLSAFHKHLITILLYLTFRQRTDIDSNLLALIANVNRDHLRRQLKEIQKIFAEGRGVPQNFVSIYFLRTGFNTPQQIIFHKNFENKSLAINPPGKTGAPSAEEILTLERFLIGSKLFKETAPALLFALSGGASIDETVKGILYVDASKSVKDPLAYFRSCFKNKKFKYEKIYNMLPEVERAHYVFTGKEISGYITPVKIKGINEAFVFRISEADFQKLKEKKTPDYNFKFIPATDSFIIWSALKGGKETNTQKALERFEIPYTIHVRAPETIQEIRRANNIKKVS